MPETRRHFMSNALMTAAVVYVQNGQLPPQPPPVLNTDILNLLDIDYVPIDPVQVRTVMVDAADGTQKEMPWSSLTEPARRKLLPNQNAKVTTAKRNAAGKLEFLPSNVSLEKGTYRVTVDYSKYRDESIFDQNKKFVGRGKVGVALRVTADVTTTKSGVNLGGLLSLAIQRNSGSISGQLEATVIGIQHPDISKLIVLPSNLDETSITKALESIGSIKILVDAPGTETTPQLIAISRANVQNPLAVIQAVTETKV